MKKLFSLALAFTVITILPTMASAQCYYYHHCHHYRHFHRYFW